MGVIEIVAIAIGILFFAPIVLMVLLGWVATFAALAQRPWSSFGARPRSRTRGTSDARRVRLTATEWEAGRKYATDGGDLVRSRGEVRVANELHRRGFRYQYEPEICGFRPDFYLPDHRIVIEYWGLDEPAYNARRRAKTAAFLKAGYKLVSLSPGKRVSIERDLGRQLFHKFRDLGLDRNGRPTGNAAT